MFKTKDLQINKILHLWAANRKLRETATTRWPKHEKDFSSPRAFDLRHTLSGLIELDKPKQLLVY